MTLLGNGNQIMNVLLFPVADGYDLEFISKDNGLPPKISRSSDETAFTVVIENFSGKVSLKRRIPQASTQTNNSTEQPSREEVTKDSIDREKEPDNSIKNEKESSDDLSAQSELIPSPPGQTLPETTSSGTFQLPPRIDTISDSKTIHSSTGSTTSTRSKSKVMSRSSSPSTLSPRLPFSTSHKSQNPWDSQGHSKSLKKPTLQKTQSKGLYGLFLRKSIIPQHIREARNLTRSYFYPANDANQTWFNEFGKVVSSPAIMKVLQHLSSRDLSDKSQKSGESDSNIAKILTPPTKLHALCAASTINYEDLEAELDERPGDASVLDGRMRTPLHVLADNDALFLDPQGRFTVTAIMARLIQIYPDAFTSKDITGRMPFVPLIEDWCVWVYDSEEQDRIRRRADAKSFFSASDEQGSDPQSIHRRMSTNPVTRAAAQVTVGATRTALAGATKVMKFVDEHIHSRVDSMFHESDEGTGRGQPPKAGRLYPQVKVREDFQQF